MRNNQIKKIAFTGIIIALIFILSFTPIGYIHVSFLPGVSITLIHIPVLIGAIVLGKKYGAVLGLIFGITSIILAFLNLATNAPFTNPLASILPRIVFGFLIAPLYSLIKKLIKNDIVSTSLTMCLATLIHTIIVLIPLFIIWRTGFYFGAEDYAANYGSGEGQTVFTFIYATLISNGIIEIVLAGVIGTPIAMAMKVVLQKNNYNEETHD